MVCIRVYIDIGLQIDRGSTRYSHCNTMGSFMISIKRRSMGSWLVRIELWANKKKKNIYLVERFRKATTETRNRLVHRKLYYRYLGTV